MRRSARGGSIRGSLGTSRDSMGHQSCPCGTWMAPRRPSPRAATDESPDPAQGWNPDALRRCAGALDDGADARRCCACPGRCARSERRPRAPDVGAPPCGRRHRSSAARGHSGDRWRTVRGRKCSSSDDGCLGRSTKSRPPAKRGWTSSLRPGRLLLDPGFATQGRPGGTFRDCTPRPLHPRGRDLLFPQASPYHRLERRPPTKVPPWRGYRREPEPSGRIDRGENQSHRTGRLRDGNQR